VCVDGCGFRDYASALVVLRPSGHHSGAGRTGPFCGINAAGVGAAAALAGGLAERVLIIDLDIHRSGGTEDVVARLWGGEGRGRVLLIDVFGAMGGLKAGAGRGGCRLVLMRSVLCVWWVAGGDGLVAPGGEEHTALVSLAHGAGDAECAAAMTAEVLPRARAFALHLTVVTIGFDGTSGLAGQGWRVLADGLAWAVSCGWVLWRLGLWG
jgi:acetoin utilization deacetylase AcuC-like enzyme